MSKIESLESSVGFDEIVTCLMNSYKSETVGELWEELISCQRCPFENQCEQLTKYFVERDKRVMCEDVINILVGDKTIEEVETELESRNY